MIIEIAVKNAAELPVAVVAQFENFSKKLLFFLAIVVNTFYNIHILNQKKAPMFYIGAYIIKVGLLYNLSLALIQFRSSNAAVNLFTKFSSPLRNQTRGS